ncbi:hypothetical protein BH09PSE2_BH09PSE2_10650 [soil metagenome]
MARGLLSETLSRVKVDRFRRSPDFEAQVSLAVEEAIAQTRAAPIDVARMKCSDPQAPATVRAVWDEVVVRLACRPDHARPERMRLAPAPAPAPPPAAEEVGDRLLFEVGVLTEAGPGSAAKRLEALAQAGRASVSVGADERGEPVLIYALAPNEATPDLADLRRPQA